MPWSPRDDHIGKEWFIEENVWRDTYIQKDVNKLHIMFFQDTNRMDVGLRCHVMLVMRGKRELALAQSCTGS